MITDSLTTWIQRAGRGGRNPDIVCECILLVQPSVFQLVAPRKKNSAKRPRKVDGGTAGIAAILLGIEPAGQESESGEQGGNESEDEPDDRIIEQDIDTEDARSAHGDEHSDGASAASGDTEDERPTPAVKTLAKSKKRTVHRVFAKKLPVDLREFVSTTDCRGAVIDKTYKNPPHEREYSVSTTVSTHSPIE